MLAQIVYILLLLPALYSVPCFQLRGLKIIRSLRMVKKNNGGSVVELEEFLNSKLQNKNGEPSNSLMIQRNTPWINKLFFRSTARELLYSPITGGHIVQEYFPYISRLEEETEIVSL